jgi:hypothetical protein
MGGERRGDPMRIILLVLVLLGGIGVAGAGEHDADTLAGMDAHVREDWIPAVRAFERALAADPEDEARAARLSAARERAVSFWLGMTRAQADAANWHAAASAALMVRLADPEAEGLEEIVTELGFAGVEVPDEAGGVLRAHPAYPGRSLAGRTRAMRSFGLLHGRAEHLVDGALGFLVRAQEPDGSWDAEKHGGRVQYSTGVTGLALLALISGGSPPEGSPQEAAARKAAAWLVGQQDPEGCIGKRLINHFIYCHAAATEGLATYAALTGMVDALKIRLERARDFLLKSQNPGLGWRYGVRPGDNDTSVTYWAIAALERLRRAGIPVDGNAFAGGVRWSEKVTEPESGLGGYTTCGSGAARLQEDLDAFPADKTRSLTAAACLIRQYGGAPSRFDELQKAQILSVPPLSAPPDMYYWHLGARALVVLDGTVPPSWYRALVEAAEANRSEDGSISASDPWGEEGGRVYTSAVTVLALATPYSEPWSGAIEDPASRFLREGKRTVRVPADADCVPTGIYVDDGMRLSFVPSGKIRVCHGVTGLGPEGCRKTPRGNDRLSRKGPFGCLLARVGAEGRFCALKRKRTLNLHGYGQLMLMVNCSDRSEGRGEFTVEITLR